jgi:opacity protein-like surface antigen
MPAEPTKEGQMMKPAVTRILILSAITLAVQFWVGVAPEAAWADEGSGTPIYIGIGPAIGFEDFSNTGGIDIDDAYGFNTWAGYRFVDFLSAEMNLEYLDGFDFDIFGADIEGEALAFTWNAKVFPLTRVITDRIDPFLYAGIGIGWLEYDAGRFGTADGTGFIARFGGGVDLYLTENLAFQASSSYVLPTGDLDDFAYVSLVFGLQYRFGQPSRP